MKKMLFVTASFFALGALLTSPLYAMDEEEKNVSNPRRVIEALKEDPTFEDYCPLILGDIGSKGYDERGNRYINILEDKWGQVPEVRFFISFLGELKKIDDFSHGLAAEARNLDVDRATPFFQALKIFVLEDFEDIEGLEEEFCESSSRYKDNSELKFIRKIYNSL